MAGLKEFQTQFDLSMPTLCARILAQHKDVIQTKKSAIAIDKLAIIIETALSLSSIKSFHSMSLRDLSKKSGLSMGALYAYFDSKDTLLMMILGQVVFAVDDVLGQPPTAMRNVPARHLQWLLETHIYLSETMHHWFAFAYMEAKSFSREGRKLAVASELTTERMISEILKDGVQSGCFTVKNHETTAALIKPLLQDWYVKRSKHLRRGMTPEGYAKAVIAFVDSAIGTKR